MAGGTAESLKRLNMPLENLREFSGPVKKTEKQNDWFLVVDKPVGLETWQRHVSQYDSIIVGVLKFQDQLLPCLGFGVAKHYNLEKHLKDLTLDGAEVIDPFHLQLHVDKDRQLDFLNVIPEYSFSLEAFAQRLILLLPQEVVRSSKVLIQCSALFDHKYSWYKFAGEAVLTKVMKSDIRGTEPAQEYFEIKAVIDPVRGQEFHARKIIDDFPEELKISTSA